MRKIRGGAHAAKIGEWVNWWISVRPKRRIVITPAPMTTWRGQSSLADILFLERPRTSNIYKKVGVAQIENHVEKAHRKLKSLRAYDQNESQYPDMQFALLCLSLYPPIDKAPNSLKKVGKYLERLSENSRLRWVVYLLVYKRIDYDEANYSIKIIDYVKDADYFYYNTEISDAGRFMYKEGKVIHSS